MQPRRCAAMSCTRQRTKTNGLSRLSRLSPMMGESPECPDGRTAFSQHAALSTQHSELGYTSSRPSSSRPLSSRPLSSRPASSRPFPPTGLRPYTPPRKHDKNPRSVWGLVNEVGDVGGTLRRDSARATAGGLRTDYGCTLGAGRNVRYRTNRCTCYRQPGHHQPARRRSAHPRSGA